MNSRKCLSKDTLPLLLMGSGTMVRKAPLQNDGATEQKESNGSPMNKREKLLYCLSHNILGFQLLLANGHICLLGSRNCVKYFRLIML